jgi:hypothetical protein
MRQFDSRVVALIRGGHQCGRARIAGLMTAASCAIRYPSDLTDEEWQLVEPLIPLGKPGGDKRTVILREVVSGLMYVLSTGSQWRAIPNTCRRRARSTTISICGPMTAHYSASTTRFMNNVANKRKGGQPGRRHHR